MASTVHDLTHMEPAKAQAIREFFAEAAKHPHKNHMVCDGGKVIGGIVTSAEAYRELLERKLLS